MITNLYTGAGITPQCGVSKIWNSFFTIFISAEAGYNFEYEPYKHFSTLRFQIFFGIQFSFLNLKNSYNEKYTLSINSNPLSFCTSYFLFSFYKSRRIEIY